MSLVMSTVGVLSRPLVIAPAPRGVLEEDRTPDFTNELNSDDKLTGRAGAVDGPAAADDVEATVRLAPPSDFTEG